MKKWYRICHLNFALMFPFDICADRILNSMWKPQRALHGFHCCFGCTSPNIIVGG